MGKNNLISLLVNGIFYAEYKYKDEFSIYQIILNDVIQLTKFYKEHEGKFESFKLVRFFSDDYEEYLRDEKFYEDTQDFYPNVSQESYAQNFSYFFDWYCLNNKDNVLEIKNFDEIMEIYDELIKID